MKFKNLLIAAGLSCALFAGQAIAMDGTVTEVEGSVLFQKKGNPKISPASAGIEFSNDDVFTILDGSKIELTYANGCKETILGSKKITIHDGACLAAVPVVAGAGLTGAGAGAGLAGAVFVGAVAVGVGVVLLSP